MSILTCSAQCNCTERPQTSFWAPAYAPGPSLLSSAPMGIHFPWGTHACMLLSPAAASIDTDSGTQPHLCSLVTGFD